MKDKEGHTIFCQFELREATALISVYDGPAQPVCAACQASIQSNYPPGVVTTLKVCAERR